MYVSQYFWDEVRNTKEKEDTRPKYYHNLTFVSQKHVRGDTVFGYLNEGKCIYIKLSYISFIYLYTALFHPCIS